LEALGAVHQQADDQRGLEEENYDHTSGARFIQRMHATMKSKIARLYFRVSVNERLTFGSDFLQEPALQA
jgi:hypothetical protein